MDLKYCDTSLEHWFQRPEVYISMCNSPLEYQIWDVDSYWDVHNREEFVEVLGYKVGTLPTTYLGLLLGGAWCTKEMRERFGVGLCKVIRNGWDVFKDKTSLQVGLGNRVKFWNDKWCGETPFEGCVPESLCYRFF
ncbi:hypothetical protein AAG906_005939 [Vitis piasezkii]